MTYHERFNDSVKAAMGLHDVNQTDLAMLLELPRRSVGQRLKGQSRWTIGEIETIARFFNVPDGAVFLGPSGWVKADPTSIATKVSDLRKRAAVTGQYTFGADDHETAEGPVDAGPTQGVPGQMSLAEAAA